MEGDGLECLERGAPAVSRPRIHFPALFKPHANSTLDRFGSTATRPATAPQAGASWVVEQVGKHDFICLVLSYLMVVFSYFV